MLCGAVSGRAMTVFCVTLSSAITFTQAQPGSFHACKARNLIQPRTAIFRSFFLCKLGNLVCFITVCISAGRLLESLLSVQAHFSLLRLFLFYLLASVFFHNPPSLPPKPPVCKRTSCLCNWPANQPDRRLFFRRFFFFTDICINMHLHLKQPVHEQVLVNRCDEVIFKSRISVFWG